MIKPFCIGCLVLAIVVVAAQANDNQANVDRCASKRCRYGAICVLEKDRPVCQCPDVCTADYNPVCGTDGVTYSNLCALKSAACRSRHRAIRPDHKGECCPDQ